MTREQVFATARQLFAERGYHMVSLADIGSKLGVSAAAVLRHAPSKEALFAEAFSPTPQDLQIPLDVLPNINADQDPRKVLRELAWAFVPFIEARFSEQIAVWAHAQTAGDAKRIAGFLRDPLGKSKGVHPPQRALALLEDYFRRAVKAGRMELKDPRAAALNFLGCLHAYVTLHHLVKVLEPPMPLERYLDSLLDIWTRGAFRAGRKKR